MKRTVALLTCLALIIPGAAVASANSTSGSYGQSGVHNVSASKNPCTTASGSGGSSSSGTGSSSNGANCADTGPISASTSTGSLPFTGLDLAALAAGGAVLLGAGMVLRRFSANNR
jgi:hypothetical protein